MSYHGENLDHTIVRRSSSASRLLEHKHDERNTAELEVERLEELRNGETLGLLELKVDTGADFVHLFLSFGFAGTSDPSQTLQCFVVSAFLDKPAGRLRNEQDAKANNSCRNNLKTDGNLPLSGAA